MNENIEMYLVSIARLAKQTCEEIVPIPALAEQLEILPVSANQMIRKLEDAGLVRYLPYKGVHLTRDGRSIANQILKHHQIWETFLVECLKFNPQKAYTLACKFEHIMSNEEIGHLSAYLTSLDVGDLERFTQFSNKAPDPIPEVQLSSLTVGQGGQITQLMAEQSVHSFLSAAGIRCGVQLTVLAVADSGHWLVQVDHKERIHLAADLVDLIWISEEQH